MAYIKPHEIEVLPGKKIGFVHEIVHIEPLPEEKAAFHAQHIQDYCELIFFCSGMREIKIGNTPHLFQAGDLMIVRPAEAHGSRNAPGMLDRYNLHIPPGTFELLGDGDALMRIFYAREIYTGNHVRLNEEMQRCIHELLMRIDHIIRFSSRVTRNAEVLACVIQLLSYLGEYTQAERQLSPTRSELLLKILSFMENEFDRDDLMREITRHFGLSRSSLWRMFREEMNITPHRYLQNIRLENARLLLHSGCDVLTAAMRCGFADSSHLIRLFKARYGVTPGKYHQAQQEKA